jgi:penicillin-binding protein 1C
LFAAFPNGGKFAPLRWQQQDTLTSERSLVSPASAYMINQILSQLKRPDLPYNADNSRNLPKIAWKTGTSYGRKDAWSIGYNKKYTVGVWIGNFSGEGVPELNGTDSATPLLFDIFNTIDYNSPAEWFAPPANFSQRVVCKASGLPVSSFCSDQVLDGFLPGISAVTKCAHLKKVLVSSDEKYAYCPSCLPNVDYKEKWLPNLAPNILAFYESEHIPYQQLPEHNPACSRIFQDDAPVIVSPTAEMEYLLEQAEEQKLMLRCQAHNEVKQVYWYINDRLIKAAPANENLFFTPKTSGKYKISCTDDQGRNTNFYILVKFLD